MAVQSGLVPWKTIASIVVTFVLAGCGAPALQPSPAAAEPALATPHIDRWTTTFAVRGTVDPLRGWQPALVGGNENCGYLNNGDDAGIVRISVLANASGVDTSATWSLFVSDGSGRHSQSVEGVLPLSFMLQTDNESFSRQPEALFGVEPRSGGGVVSQDVEFTVDIEWTGPETPQVYVDGITCS